MNLETTIQLDPELLYSKIGEEIVLLDIESGKYFKVDAIGSRIWEFIKEPICVELLCKQLIEEFECNLEECTDDVIPFLKKLNDSKLIIVS